MIVEIIGDDAYNASVEMVMLFVGEDFSAENTTKMNQDVFKNVYKVVQKYPHYRKYGEINRLHSLADMKQILLVGTGKYAELTVDKVRALAGMAARTAQEQKVSAVSINLIHAQFLSLSMIQAIVEGSILGSYQFNCYKSKHDSSVLNKLFVCVEEPALYDEAVQHGKIIAESVNFARDLVNHPGAFMTPAQMVREAEKIALTNGLLMNVLEQKDMEKENMQALLAVAQGSSQSPKMIILQYWGNKISKEITAFVGKGITFDSGGISIKPSENMGAMKGDMAGGAAVLGAMLAIAKLKPKTNILGVIPCAENMPSGHAYRPGDVISSMSNKTIEVISTDAEGRLILADAITYTRKLKASKIIDVATLTGACVVALGNITSGVITNNDNLCQQVLAAAQEAGEKMWQLPNFDEYKELIKSDIADIKNTGGKGAGAITGGLFIAEFAEDTPWVHIDIAGTSDSNKDKGYNVKGATGAGVRTLVQLARQENNVC